MWLPEGGGGRTDSDREWGALESTLECRVGERGTQPAFVIGQVWEGAGTPKWVALGGAEGDRAGEDI